MLENAGLVKGTITNSDRYMALRLTKEFDQILESMNVKASQEISKSMLYEIFVKLSLLKSLEQLNSEFLTVENLQMFESVWIKISGSESEEVTVTIENVRFFFLNLNYLYGDWLLRAKLFSRKNLPDRC